MSDEMEKWKDEGEGWKKGKIKVQMKKRSENMAGGELKNACGGEREG